MNILFNIFNKPAKYALQKRKMRPKRLNDHKSMELSSVGGRNQTQDSDFKHNAIALCVLKALSTNIIVNIHKTDELK